MNRDQEMRLRLEESASEWQLLRGRLAHISDRDLRMQLSARVDELEPAAYAHYRLAALSGQLRVAEQLLASDTDWTPFGSHQDGPVTLAFAGQDEVGLPIYERPVS